MSYRPRLTAEQIKSLKTQIKFLGDAIAKAVKNTNSSGFPVTASQNAVSRELGFAGFNELASKEVPTEHHPDFELVSALNIQQVYNAFVQLNFKGGRSAKGVLTVEHVALAMNKLGDEPYNSTEPSIKLLDLYEIINEDEYNHGHKYVEGDGFPSSFTVGTKTEFFDTLRDWDHFRVYDGSEYKCFTVEQFDYIYDKKIKLFKVVVGRRYENGLSVGDK